MHLLVTRPRHQAQSTAATLEARGHTVSIEPMLNVNPLATPMPDGNFDGVILTSANALPSLANQPKLEELLSLPVLTTGKATKSAALEHGFSNVEQNTGSALDLVAQVPDWMARHDVGNRILYPCAESTAHDLNALLAGQGVSCIHWPVYRTEPAHALSEATQRALQNNKIDAVLLYSKRTAHTFVQLMQQNNLAMEGLHAYVMSQDIYDALPKELQDHAQYPDKPVEADLMNLIGP